MRPYRGKRKDNGEWAKGYLVGAGLHYDYKYILPIEKPQNTGFPSPIIHNGSTSISGFVEVDPATVGQSIGKFDKNNQEVFAGDFIKKCGEQQIMGYSYVYFNEHTACWGLVAWNHSFTPFYRYCIHDTSDSGGIVHSKMLDWENYEIIGTIHDDPELLEKQNESRKV